MEFETAILKFLAEKHKSQKRLTDPYYPLSDVFPNLDKMDTFSLFDSVITLKSSKYISVKGKLKVPSSLSKISIKLTTDGWEYYNKEFTEKLPSRLRKPMLILAGLLVILMVIETTIGLFKNNNPSISIESLSNMTKKESKKNEALNIDTSKINIVITHFRNNDEVAELLHNRLLSLVSPEDTSFINIRVATTFDIAIQSDSINNFMNTNLVDILLFGSFYSHGNFSHHDTAKIYYRWAVKEQLYPGFPKAKITPLGNPIFSMDDVVLGKHQEEFDFIINYSIAKHYLFRNESEIPKYSDEKALFYLKKARENKLDKTVSFLIFGLNELLGVDNFSELIYTTTNFSNDIYFLDAIRFFYANSKEDTATAFALGNKLIWEYKVPKQHLYGVLKQTIMNNLAVLYHNNNRFLEETKIYMYHSIINPENEKHYIDVACGIALIGGNFALKKQIHYLDSVYQRHPNFLEVRNFLAVTLYSAYLISNDMSEKNGYLSKARAIYNNIENEFPMGYVNNSNSY